MRIYFHFLIILYFSVGV